MCGIAGYRFLGTHDPDAERDLAVAVERLSHRGPDDDGIWVGDLGAIGLGFRRLAILDLSPLGHQPMVSACGDWIMVYNGEVYNFRRIRSELEHLGHRFRSEGDAEVVLAAFSEWGMRAVERFIGMFAIGIWQVSTKSLYLFRDRLGVKPLYYYWDGSTFLFGSELKALRAFRFWNPQVDHESIADYFRYGYICDPRSVYQKVCKLPPAHCAELSREARLTVSRYWDPFDHVGARFGCSEDDLIDDFESLLVDAFTYRLVADVPVGVFLSGGMDSSLLTAILRKHSAGAVKTYTIGFDSEDFDESRYASVVASHIGTDHHSRILSSHDVMDALPRWPDLYDEPFADESGIATLMVSEFASEQVTVALSADGGDELFSGYNSYATALNRVERLERVPAGVRELAARSAAVPALLGTKSPRLGRVRRLLEADGAGQVFDEGVSLMNREEVRALVGVPPPERTSADAYPGTPGEQFCAWDLHHYLPGDVLTKVDRATMAASIEGREPLLDHRVVEFALSLPFTLRRGELGPKHLLKRVLYKYVPRELVDRPKRGFAVPVTDWLATDLRHVVNELLDKSEVARAGVLEPATVSAWLARMDAGDVSARRKVWLMIAYQLWQRRWLPH